MLNLTCRPNRDQSTVTDFSNFLSVLDTKFLSSLAIRRLCLRGAIDNMSHTEFYFWTTAIIRDCPPSLTSQSQLQLVLTWPWLQIRFRDPDVKALTCVFNAMNLHFLTQLRITAKNVIDPWTWTKTFGMLPLLERVYVQENAIYSLFAALLYKADTSKTAYFNVSFPKLRYIHVNDADFALRVDRLLDWLMERYERNAEVQVLRLVDCYNISASDIERLKEVVVDVIWDGVEQRTHEKRKKERIFDNEGNIDTIVDLDYDNGDFICRGSCSLHGSHRF